MFHLENGATLPADTDITIIVWQSVPAGKLPGIMGVDRAVDRPMVGDAVVTLERDQRNPYTGGWLTDLEYSRLVAIDEGTRRRIVHGYNGSGAGILTWEYVRGEWMIVEWECPFGGRPMWDSYFKGWLIMPENCSPSLTRSLIPFRDAPRAARQTFRMR